MTMVGICGEVTKIPKKRSELIEVVHGKKFRRWDSQTSVVQ